MKTFEVAMMIFFLLAAMVAMQVMGYNLLGALNAPDSADLIFHLRLAGFSAVVVAMCIATARLAEIESLKA